MIFDIIQIEKPISLFFLSFSATRYDPVADRTTATILAISNRLIIFVFIKHTKLFFCDKLTLAVYFCTDNTVWSIHNSTDIICCYITFAIVAFEWDI